MVNRIISCICLFLLVHAGKAQDSEPYAEKEFVIILSSRVYDDALQMAKKAAIQLQLKLDLRGLEKDTGTGLSWDKKTCEAEWDEFPCYLARGRFDDGSYVSIEYSDAYQGFTRGYYLVIIAGGEKGDSQVKQTLAKAKKIYKDAYSKITKVYLGCMH